MKNIYSNIYKPTNNNLSKAKVAIEKGDVVAIPTETVYGLAANAYNTKAVKKIFSLKKRPSNNPLIIHFKNAEQIRKEAVINKNFLKLVKKFSPGPLTYILKKRSSSKISKLANKALATIAVRIPSEKNTIKLLNILNCPLAAPSDGCIPAFNINVTTIAVVISVYSTPKLNLRIDRANKATTATGTSLAMIDV